MLFNDAHVIMIHEVRKAIVRFLALGRDECSFHESDVNVVVSRSRYIHNLIET